MTQDLHLYPGKMTRKEIYYADFDVSDVTLKINTLMSRWSTHLIEIKGQKWKVYNHSGDVVYEFDFLIDFKNVEARVKLEDLRLNIIHHIEGMRDDTAYIDELVEEDLLFD